MRSAHLALSTCPHKAINRKRGEILAHLQLVIEKRFRIFIFLDRALSNKFKIGSFTIFCGDIDISSWSDSFNNLFFFFLFIIRYVNYFLCWLGLFVIWLIHLSLIVLFAQIDLQYSRLLGCLLHWGTSV